MALTTNLTLLIPARKVYCDFSFTMEVVGGEKARGQWSLIDYMPTPPRVGYSKFNSFVDKNGDAFLDKGAAPGFHLFMLRFGFLTNPVMALIGGAFARIDMDVKDHIFSPGKATWAKKAELVPSMEEAIAIFWK